jgi:hypothetical protein
MFFNISELVYVIVKVMLKIVTLGHYPSEDIINKRKEIVIVAVFFIVFVFLIIWFLYS